MKLRAVLCSTIDLLFEFVYDFIVISIMIFIVIFIMIFIANLNQWFKSNDLNQLHPAAAVHFRATSSKPWATLTRSISPCLIASENLLSDSQIRTWADCKNILCCSSAVANSFVSCSLISSMALTFASWTRVRSFLEQLPVLAASVPLFSCASLAAHHLMRDW